MRYEHGFCVRAPLATVSEFHSRSESMAAITPPVIPVRMKEAPARLASGDQMAFRMWLGPLPVSWRAYVGNVSPMGFTDHQLEGPFRYWVHRHSFKRVDDETTQVTDLVQARLRWHPLWGVVGLAVWLGLPLLFAFRGWKTRRLLAGCKRMRRVVVVGAGIGGLSAATVLASAGEVCMGTTERVGLVHVSRVVRE